MENYNYADEMVKDKDHLYQRSYRAASGSPKEEILNEEDQQLPVNVEDKDAIDPSEKEKAYQEGKKDDSATEELIPEKK